MKWLVQIFLACILSLVSNAQTSIYLKGSTDISVSIGLLRSSYPVQSDSLHEVKMTIELVNNSTKAIEIYPDIFDRVTTIGEYDAIIQSEGTTYITYYNRYYDPLDKRWRNINNNTTYNNMDRVVDPENREVKNIFIEPGKSYRESRRIFWDFNYSDKGSYRIQIVLGIKASKNAFVMFESNILDLELY